MLIDQTAIDRAVNQTFPDGLPEGHTVGVVGLVDNHGVQAVATVRLLGDALKAEGYYEHPWSGSDTYGGAILFSK